MSDNKHLGMGVMIEMLSGNRDTIRAVRGSYGRQIASVAIIDDNSEAKIRVDFADGTHLLLWDNGQSCCENRYVRTDDDLAYHAGAELQAVELREAPNEADEYGDHEVQFLLLTTSKGVITFANHNEHNGYYGGFAIRAEGDTARPDDGL